MKWEIEKNPEHSEHDWARPSVSLVMCVTSWHGQWKYIDYTQLQRHSIRLHSRVGITWFLANAEDKYEFAAPPDVLISSISYDFWHLLYFIAHKSPMTCPPHHEFKISSSNEKIAKLVRLESVWTFSNWNKLHRNWSGLSFSYIIRIETYVCWAPKNGQSQSCVILRKPDEIFLEIGFYSNLAKASGSRVVAAHLKCKVEYKNGKFLYNNRRHT